MEAPGVADVRVTVRGALSMPEGAENCTRAGSGGAGSLAAPGVACAMYPDKLGSAALRPKEMSSSCGGNSGVKAWMTPAAFVRARYSPSLLRRKFVCH